MFIKYKEFQLRQCAESNKLEVVKWSGDCCFVLAFIKWNPKEPCWEFESVGLRYLHYYEDGLSEYILKCLELMDFIKQDED